MRRARSLQSLGVGNAKKASQPTLAIRPVADVKARRDRLYAQLKEHFHRLIEGAADKRHGRWASDATSPNEWRKSLPAMRDAYLDVMGHCDFLQRALLNPRSELVYDTEDYLGYKVLVDVFEGLEAYGILLVPKNLKDGERRPAVISQHGFAGTPERVIGPGDSAVRRAEGIHADQMRGDVHLGYSQ